MIQNRSFCHCGSSRIVLVGEPQQHRRQRDRQPDLVRVLAGLSRNARALGSFRLRRSYNRVGGKHHKAMNSPSVRRQIASPDRLGRFSTASDNAPKTPSKLTREELCRQVWESPSVACVTIPVSEVMTLTLQNRVEDDPCRCRSRLKVARFRSFVARTSRFLAGIRVGSDFWLRSLELSQVI